MIVDEYAPTDVRVMNEAIILQNAGYEVYILDQVYDKNLSVKHLITDEGITISHVYMPRRVKAILKLLVNRYPKYEDLWGRAIRQFALKYDIDILHVHDLYMSRAAGLASREIPMILDLHENYPSAIFLYRSSTSWWQRILSKPEKWLKKEKEYLAYADHIIVLSESFRELLQSRYPDLPTDFTVFPNLPMLSRYAKSKGGEKLPDIVLRHDVTLLYFGRIAHRRGVFTLLEAVKELSSRGVFVNCLFIGPVDRADRGRFDDYLSRDQDALFYYVPWIDQSDLAMYGELVDVCVAPFLKNPQHESGVANKIYQYMMLSKPLIVSNCLPQQQIVEKYDCGLVFTSESVDELANCIEELRGDPARRTNMGSRGKQAVLSDLNLDVSKERLLTLYSQYASVL